MLFHSPVFFLFLAVVLLGRWLLPWRAGQLLLLAASYVFYGMIEPSYCLLLAGSTAIDFWVALALDRVESPGRRRLLLAVSLTVNLGLLGAFKYGDFVLHNMAVVLGQPPLAQLSWVLPIGISFFTFQTLSYSIDVYRRKTEPCRDPATFALYVCFFPQLVAGPIERASNLLPQLRRKAVVSSTDFALGFQRILWGLVKKLVVADRLAFFVGDVFAAPAEVSGAAVALATLAATAQIYLDFSAYTDIALGVARMMGVRLSENFRWPFLSSNPAEFWARWHITLTQWFRDYVGRPLGGVQAQRPLRTALRVVFVMGLVGLWHGARWNFVVFGLVAGLGLAITSWRRAVLKASGRWRDPRGLSRLLRVFGTLAYVNLCMLIFVSPDLGRARVALWKCVDGGWAWEPGFAAPVVLVGCVGLLHIVRGIWFAEGRRELSLPAPLRGLFWAGLSLLVLYGVPDKVAPFVYFQF